jgi:hypothetical protein
MRPHLALAALVLDLAVIVSSSCDGVRAGRAPTRPGLYFENCSIKILMRRICAEIERALFNSIFNEEPNGQSQ